jgi:hypothetical protein
MGSLMSPRPVQVVNRLSNGQRVGAVVDVPIAETDRLGIEAVWLQPSDFGGRHRPTALTEVGTALASGRSRARQIEGHGSEPWPRLLNRATTRSATSHGLQRLLPRWLRAVEPEHRRRPFAASPTHT